MSVIVLLACGAADRDKRVLVPPQEPDSGALDMLGRQDVCVADAEYVANRKACNADADCALFTYQQTCCGERLIVGIASEDLADAELCTKPVCTCKPGLPRAEDGRFVADLNSGAAALCIDQRCSSRVLQRQCGAKRLCAPNEICVTYENVPGGFPPDPDSGDNAYLTFRCEPNPCPDRLDCACAQPLCDARNDALRTCEIKNNEESDLTCSPVVD